MKWQVWLESPRLLTASPRPPRQEQEEQDGCQPAVDPSPQQHGALRHAGWALGKDPMSQKGGEFCALTGGPADLTVSSGNINFQGKQCRDVCQQEGPPHSTIGKVSLNAPKTN